MKKAFIIANSVLGFFSIYCFFNFVIVYIYEFIESITKRNTSTLYIIFHSDNRLMLLAIVLILQVLVNIFILLVAKAKEK